MPITPETGSLFHAETHLAECKARMQFVQQHLQANVDKESSLKYLKKTYDKYLSGIVEIDPEMVPEPDATADA